MPRRNRGPYEYVKLDYCNGKPCYDKKGARTAANKRFKEAHQKLRIYECPDCDRWHLTSSL